MRKLLLLIPAFIYPVLLLCQTISPINVDNDSIDVTKVQFIDPASGKLFKTNVNGQMVSITETYPDTINIILALKNGKTIFLDSVVTSYLDISCVIRVTRDNSHLTECAGIVYWFGDRVIIGNNNCSPNKTGSQVDISFNTFYYEKMTKDRGINLVERLNSKEYAERMRKRYLKHQF